MDRSKKERHIEHLCADLLRTLGYDPMTPSLRDTPSRWAKWWMDFQSSVTDGPHTTFHIKGEEQLVLLSGIRVWSVCEHHLLPFSVDFSIAYRPVDSVLGLSKFSRIAHAKASRLQLQERLTQEIASAIRDATGSADVGVLGRGRHLCIEARGVRNASRATTVVLLGAFRNSSPFDVKYSPRELDSLDE